MSADLFAAFGPGKLKTKQLWASTSKQTTSHGNHVAGFHPSTPLGNALQQVDEQKEPSPLWKRAVDGSDMLFDAGENDFEDDFGAFETAGKPGIERVAASLASSSKLVGSPDPVSDLLGIDDDILGTVHPAHKVFQPPEAHHATPESWDIDQDDNVEDDGWGEYQETKPAEPSDTSNFRIIQTPLPQVKAQETVADISEDGWEPNDDSTSASTALHSSAPTLRSRDTTKQTGPRVFDRPTNVPPPSSLLQLMSTVIQVIHASKADGITPNLDLASKVLLVFRTSTRLVAGRVLRWKRDTNLAQSVRIGQAGKAGGMKLATVNKSETTKEQRDAEDLAQDWSKHVHFFNSILAQAGLPPHRMKLHSTTPLIISKQCGVSNPAKQCALCGLKRSERLSDVDVDIDDLFGEFWIEHWGHKDCCDFWQSYSGLLGQR